MADAVDQDWVEVVYATAERQRIVKLAREAGMTAGDAVRRSGLIDSDSGLQGGDYMLGIFGSRVDAGRVLESGDRVEICQRLKHDPRQMRRALLADGRVMGRAGRAREPVKTDRE